MKCITTAWDLHEPELRNYLYRQIGDPVMAEDILQDVFVKALAKLDVFCKLDNSRAWLFRVAKNRIIDHYRKHKEHHDLDEQHPEKTVQIAPVVKLSNCLPSALKQLKVKDRDIIESCDLGGLSQQAYADQHNISLVATKSRIQRARKQLKQQLHLCCQVVLDESGNVCCFKSQC